MSSPYSIPPSSFGKVYNVSENADQVVSDTNTPFKVRTVAFEEFKWVDCLDVYRIVVRNPESNPKAVRTMFMSNFAQRYNINSFLKRFKVPSSLHTRAGNHRLFVRADYLLFVVLVEKAPSEPGQLKKIHKPENKPQLKLLRAIMYELLELPNPDDDVDEDATISDAESEYSSTAGRASRWY